MKSKIQTPLSSIWDSLETTVGTVHYPPMSRLWAIIQPNTHARVNDWHLIFHNTQNQKVDLYGEGITYYQSRPDQRLIKRNKSMKAHILSLFKSESLGVSISSFIAHFLKFLDVLMLLWNMESFSDLMIDVVYL